MAIGHDAKLKPVKNWDLADFGGCGALRSTANDMLTFLAAELGFKYRVERCDGRTGGSAPLLGQPPSGCAGNVGRVGLDTTARTRAARSSGTMAAPAATAPSPASIPRRAPAWWSCPTPPTEADGDDIGFHILTGSKLSEPFKARTEVALDRSAKEALIGRYQLRPDFILTVSLEDGQLFGQATGQEKLPLFAESPTQLFLKMVNAELTFTLGPDGHAASLILHQNGRDMPAPRMVRGSLLS